MANRKEANINIANNNKSISLPIIESTLGPQAIDIQNLYKEHGYFAFDPGFYSTASCESKITFTDGEKGILLHAGYDIRELAKYSNYLELCYLLINGQLPNIMQYEEFSKHIRSHSLLHEQISNFYHGFRRDAHPMAIMVGVVGALSAFYHDNLDVTDAKQRCFTAYRIIAKMPTIAAMAYKYSMGQPFVYPRNDLNYTENFLYMLFSIPSAEYKINPVIARALDRIMILHADHEQNASTSTVRLASSSMANPFACMAAGIASLWGRAHGGANEAVISMLEQIKTSDRINQFLKKAKSSQDPFRLMGFGHRVYKNFDPRAAVLKESADEVLDLLGYKTPLLKLAKELESIALQDEYFIKKRLFPNVDFYSGIILQAIGVPVSMFTVFFAVARSVGWVAHWLEMRESLPNKIGRPRQVYVGPQYRKFVWLDDRK